MAERTRWTVEIEDHKSPNDWYAAAIWEHQDDGSIHIVARVPQSEHGWDPSVQERDEANARLISAAPDLLAACLAYQDWTDASERAAFDNSMANLDAESEASDRFENLREAAIAKATGKGGPDVAGE